MSSSRPELRPYLSYSIWIDCPRHIRLARGLERNGPDSLPSWQFWMGEEDVWMERDQPRDEVSLVVDGEAPLD